ncbi:MAG TPA: hypothetical protein VF668_23090 [Pyrinomonadaceae bacterium]|jgi:apolipoprotein N-acyltransferase
MKSGNVIGLVLSCIYLLAAAMMIAEDVRCEGMFCGFGLVMAGMPWTLPFADSGSLWLHYLTGLGGVALNAVILFLTPGLLAEAFRSEPPR